MNKLLVVCGPTATGKTALAVKLAQEFDGELLSADSRQVYRGMDIGTGKDQPRGVKVHLIDLVKPNQEFSFAHFYRLAWQEIRNLWRREKLPVLVGGTGFYIKGLIDGIETREIPRSLSLRKRVDSWSVEELFSYLAQVDFERAGSMNQSDKKNPRRLVRAIEVALYRRENSAWQPERQVKSDFLLIGLKASLKVVDERIDLRVKKRLKLGLEEEIRELLNQGYTWNKSALGDTLGYQEWQPFFEGEETRKAVINRWRIDERQYARKQMTWFKKDKRINWFDIGRKGWENKVEAVVKKWYTEGNG